MCYEVVYPKEPDYLRYDYKTYTPIGVKEEGHPFLYHLLSTREVVEDISKEINEHLICKEIIRDIKSLGENVKVRLYYRYKNGQIVHNRPSTAKVLTGDIFGQSLPDLYSITSHIRVALEVMEEIEESTKETTKND